MEQALLDLLQLGDQRLGRLDLGVEGVKDAGDELLLI
ncbi:hypothetical protein Q671_04580 [Halomonas sp. PBN3]|nr:hypothetical protein Q671_04580 [Halomonas sp. PBN3]